MKRVLRRLTSQLQGETLGICGYASAQVSDNVGQCIIHISIDYRYTHLGFIHKYINQLALFSGGQLLRKA